MEFKGTQGKWRKSVNRNGDMEISGKGFDLLAIVNLYPEGYWEKHIKNKETVSPEPDIQKNYRYQCLYNALLISKAPEMLEMLGKHIVLLRMILKHVSTTEDFKLKEYKELIKEKIKETEQLIKEATEL